MQTRTVHADEASLSRSGEIPRGPLFVVEFDFDNKIEKRIELLRAPGAVAEGRFVWVDVDTTDTEAARRSLADLGWVAEEVIEDALIGEPATQTGRYEDSLHIVVSGCRLRGAHLDLERVDMVVGQSFLVTLHKGPIIFLDAVRKQYKADFYRFAKSPSFLMYELWDNLLQNYLHVQKQFEERVEKLQAQLIGDVNDQVFAQVSEIGADLLHFRKVLLPARAVLTELSTRKSLFVSEATQTFLANMVGTVERVLQDLLVDRDILSESLNLYMSMVGHRTNRVMNRLTVVSVIFLPLSFLCGVYGMNFEVLPELKWHYGYLYFWITVAGIVVTLLSIMRRNRLI